MKKVWFGIAILLGAIFLAVTGCFIEDDPDDLGNITTSGAYGNGTFSGKVEGSGWGYGPSRIRVTLDIELGKITAVDIVHSESPEFGGVLITKVKPLIVKANSFEIDAITKSTCTYTRDGLLEAGRAAIKEIPEVE